ncbi:MAG: hypothetical protein NC311_14885 [Muribaculaceae bacterium]|nr:hypothetical protein [Muribaculaceae bacterium]
MNRHIIITISAALLSIGGIQAQNLEESLTVEGRYTPEVISADRLSVSPTTITITAPESNLNYEMRGVTAAFAPDALAMAATGWRTSKAFDESRGYLNLRLGSWLNSSLSAGVAAIKNEDTRLNVWLQHNSTSLWKAWTADPEKGIEEDADKRYRYDETIGADFSHRFAGAGTLSADVQYHLGLFNYYGTNWKQSTDDRIKAPGQTLNDIYANLAWTGKPTDKIEYSIGADVRYFGYRSEYLVGYSLPYEYSSSFYRNLYRGNANRETTFNAGGHIKYDLTEGHGLGLGLHYSGVFNTLETEVGPVDNLNLAKLTPAYEYNNDKIWLRIGAELALESGWQTRFRVAPDVRFSLINGMTTFAAKIGGGTKLRTMAWLHQMDYYCNPGYWCDVAAYSPIEASLSLQFNPGGKWTFGIEGTWCTTLDETLGGTYQAELNDNYSYNKLTDINRLHGFSIGLNAGYEFSRYFGLNGKFNWQPQNGNAGFLNGFDRPEFTLHAGAHSNPTDALTLTLDYELRAKRYLLSGNISRLNFSANYRINEKLSVGLDLNNLLNRHEMLLPDLPTEGFTAMGGVQIKF